MIAYHGVLDVPRNLVGYLSALLQTAQRARRPRTGTRALTCWTQALVVLAWFRRTGELRWYFGGSGVLRRHLAAGELDD